MGIEYPAMIYRPGDMFLWDGEHFDYLIVENDGELNAALGSGWSIGKPNETEEPVKPRVRPRKAAP